MPFFLIDRDRSDGSVRLLSAELFMSREDALAALPALVVSGEPGRDHFVCDLDAATPVLFVPQPAPAGAPEPVAEAEPVVAVEEIAEESVGVWETPMDEVAEEMPTEEPVVSEDAYPEAPSLADAIRRATNSLESEGIVAPESVPPMSVVEDLEEAPEPDSVGDEAAVDAEPLEEAAEEMPGSTYSEELASAIASLGIEEAPAEDVAEAPEVEPVEAPGGTEWPWANVEMVTEDGSESEVVAEVTVLAPEDVAEETNPAPEEQPVIEDDEIADLVEELSRPVADDEDTLIMPNPDAADFMPRAVIMGDYGDMPAEPASENPPVEMVQEAPEAVAESEETVALEVVEETVAYEPGELELGDYTCNDCVYSNTCPKAGSSSPSECGSFQWKAV